MSNLNGLRVRRSVRDLQKLYDTDEDKKPLEDLVRAWAGIKALPPSDPKSFFALGGYHGEPFQYRKPVDALPPDDIYPYWGGYCNHGNVLFPTWHRMYVYKLEEALQSIVPGVSMPFWDETDDYTLKHGIPSILTQETFVLDGKEIDNPLRSFVLPEALSDHLPGDGNIYEKPKGYVTKRYPLSGLVGTPEAREQTTIHNAKFPNPKKNTELLNSNVKAWLRGSSPTPEDPNPTRNGVYAKYIRCLSAPNYTVFSNTTSASVWNSSNPGYVTPVESPHNDIHLSVGGFDLGNGPGDEVGQIAGANGDMGENNTAGMDPIFFFHHCNVDRMFWVWQKQTGHTDHLDIIRDYPGTNASDSQGPTPGFAPGEALGLKTPLNPFRKSNGDAYMSEDCINIERQLGFTYGRGSLDDVASELKASLLAVPSGNSTKKLTVTGVDRAQFQGSFIMKAYAAVTDSNGKTREYYLGHKSVLSRWNVVHCANCLTHLDVVAHFPLSAIPADDVPKAKFRVEFIHRGGGVPSAARAAIATVAGLQPQFEVAD
ncbi:tyrosinase [Burkholderia mayonis]|uniref:Tyrosinase n=1 Tax=Burkholderia mayonis TaxID=1385591 RepID=A0A1B4FNC0_9BURK|nr:tyrosinase family protein [Burkholderia mayonis]AOJ05180.1 tyrosinase [Burkholderia mayonis]KVE44933.1 tyrosinase [Burkholderia mayonis]